MGRSVCYLSRAIHVTYINRQDDEPDETTDYYIAQENWQWFKDGLVETIQEVCPSLDEGKRWDGRETLIFLENDHAELGLSEYCGLVSVSIRVHEGYYTKENLAQHWINQVWPKILTALDKRYHTLNKVATFSNGEGIFEERKQITSPIKSA